MYENMNRGQIFRLLKQGKITIYDIAEREDFEKIYNDALRQNIIKPEEGITTFAIEETSDEGLQTNAYFINKMFHDNLKKYVDEKTEEEITEDYLLSLINSDGLNGYYKDTVYKFCSLRKTIDLSNVSILKYNIDSEHEFSVCIKDGFSMFKDYNGNVYNYFWALVFNDDNIVLFKTSPTGGGWYGKYMDERYKAYNLNPKVRIWNQCVSLQGTHDTTVGGFNNFMNSTNVYKQADGNDICADFYVICDSDDEFDKIVDNYIQRIRLFIFYTYTPPFKESNDICMEYIKESYGYDYELKLDFTAHAQTNAPSGGNYQFKIIGPNNIIVDWGDGKLSKIDNAQGDIYHTYDNHLHCDLFRIKVYAPKDEYLNITTIRAHTIYKIDVSRCTDISLEAHEIKEKLNISNTFTNYNGSSCFMIGGSADLSECDFSNLIDGNNLFMCSQSSVPSTIDFSKISNMEYMFQQSLYLTDASSVDTTTATTADGMFLSCNSLPSLPQLNFENCTSINCLVGECQSLSKLDVINTGKVKDFSELCLACIHMEEVGILDMSSCDMSNYSGVSIMFKDCWSLRSVTLSGSQSADIINAVIAELPTNEYDGERILDISRCINKDAVTATAYGWTIVK